MQVPLRIYNPIRRNHVLYIPSPLNRCILRTEYGRKLHLRFVQTIRIDKSFDPFVQITRDLYSSPPNEMHFSDRIRTENCFLRSVKLYGS